MLATWTEMTTGERVQSIAALVAALAVLIVIWKSPRRKSNADELRDLRRYFRRKDAAERRGEVHPHEWHTDQAVREREARQRR